MEWGGRRGVTANVASSPPTLPPPLLSQSLLENPNQAGDSLPAERTIQGSHTCARLHPLPWALTWTLKGGGRECEEEEEGTGMKSTK